MEDRYLNVKQVAEMLSCTPATIWLKVRTSDFPKPIRKVGTRWLESAVREWMEQ